MAGVLFRRAHDVVPSSAGLGQAVFGREFFQDEVLLHDPPFPGAVTEVEFSPPRAQARYLFEFWCRGDDIGVQGSDGVSLQTNGSFSVVFSSGATSVTYTIGSPTFWHFFGCRMSWLSA